MFDEPQSMSHYNYLTHEPFLFIEDRQWALGHMLHIAKDEQDYIENVFEPALEYMLIQNQIKNCLLLFGILTFTKEVIAAGEEEGLGREEMIEDLEELLAGQWADDILTHLDEGCFSMRLENPLERPVMTNLNYPVNLS